MNIQVEYREVLIFFKLWLYEVLSSIVFAIHIYFNIVYIVIIINIITYIMYRVVYGLVHSNEKFLVSDSWGIINIEIIANIVNAKFYI